MVDLNPARRSPRHAVTPLAQRFKIHLQEKVAQVRLSQERLLQALSILIKNAFEASAATDTVTLNVTSSDQQLRLEVRDGGSGMTRETIARLGQSFFTTKPTGKGMGLGLFLVRTFVNQYKGSLEVQSSPGQGTTIALVFPILKNSP